jgi:DNA-binding transcriptional ArsR family regulator
MNPRGADLMLRMSLSLADLASVRFAISPAWEVVASLRVLRDPGAHAVHLPWVTRHRATVLASPALHQLRDLVIAPQRHLPGFLAPAPHSPVAEPEAEFAAVRQTPAAVVREELERVYGDRLPASLSDLRRAPRRTLPMIVDEMRAYWGLTLAPHWGRIRGILEADVMFRARRLADDGPHRMFPELDPAISWSHDVLSVDRPNLDQDYELGGRGLVLVPSLFAWPNVFVKASEPWAPVLRYPARGVGSMWHSDPPAVDLAPVIGQARATLLAELTTPSTTTSLAHRTGLTPSGVSAHLSRLVTAGLVTRQRAGRLVFYVRAPRGDTLLGG